MPVDNPNKRASAGNITWIIIYPLPDGLIDEFDREQSTGLYGGIAAGVAVAPPSPSAVPTPTPITVAGGGPERIRRKRYPEVYITSTEFEDEDIVIILN